VKKSRYTEAQIVGIFKEHEAGEATKEICRRSMQIGYCELEAKSSS
jgi:hypothetical protein